MKDFFGADYVGEAFEMFSVPHITAIFILLLMGMMIYIYREKLRKEKVNFLFRISIGVILILEQTLLYAWYHINNLWSFSVSLPFNLCEAAVILAIILVFTKSFFLYEILYFWAMCGVLSAIITPDLNGYNLSHFIFYHFFITHGLVVLAVLFMTFVNGYKPKVNSIVRVMFVTNIYAAFVAVINTVTGGNYLFLFEKPKASSIMDYLGPWPWYILSLEGVAFVGFILLYLPFRICNKLDH